MRVRLLSQGQQHTQWASISLRVIRGQQSPSYNIRPDLAFLEARPSVGLYKKKDIRPILRSSKHDRPLDRSAARHARRRTCKPASTAIFGPLCGQARWAIATWASSSIPGFASLCLTTRCSCLLLVVIEQGSWPLGPECALLKQSIWGAPLLITLVHHTVEAYRRSFTYILMTDRGMLGSLRKYSLYLNRLRPHKCKPVLNKHPCNIKVSNAWMTLAKIVWTASLY